MLCQRVLIVCSRPFLSAELSKTFESHDCEVLTAISSKEARIIARQCLPELVVVDLDLLAIDGLSFCSSLRTSAVTRHIPILMLSDGRGDEEELLSLSRAADDYLLKPFRPDYLMYRVAVLLRKKTTHQQIPSQTRLDGLEIDFHRRAALLDGSDLDLTTTEFQIVWTMTQNPGFVFSRTELVNESRGEFANCSIRTVDVHIGSIRRKLGRLGALVETVRGAGYRFRETPVSRTTKNENPHGYVSSSETEALPFPTSVPATGHLVLT